MNRQITYEEVSKHADEKNSWIIIHHDVYDVTHFLDEHPGGAESLLEYAGKDGTQAFEDVAHSEDARELMKKYKIGTIPESERKKHRPKCGFVPYQTELIVLPAKDPPNTEPKFICCPPSCCSSPNSRNARTGPEETGGNTLYLALVVLGTAVVVGAVVFKYKS